MELLFAAAIFGVAILSGATAAISGFGIGSLLTPLLALRVGTPTAVAAIALPHAAATMLRCWRLRRDIDWPVLRRFGLLSAAGGLAGALLYSRLGSHALTMILGALLVLTGLGGLTGWTSRLPPRGVVVWAMGLLSGFFGGIAGNQGGLRSAALLSFDLRPVPFVATATATGVLVDAARTPVYLSRAGAALAPLAVTIAIATAGVLIGTIAGERILLGLSRERFRLIVSALIGAIGVLLMVSS
jgi:uncharacterized membrane protein YfcA